MTSFMRVCPRRDCAELNPGDAEKCETCGTRLVPVSKMVVPVPRWLQAVQRDKGKA